MKRAIALLLCLISCLGCALTAAAAEVSELPESGNESTVFFVIALIVAIGGSIYLYFMLKK